MKSWFFGALLLFVLPLIQACDSEIASSSSTEETKVIEETVAPKAEEPKPPEPQPQEPQSPEPPEPQGPEPAQTPSQPQEAKPTPGHLVISDFESLTFQGNRPSLMVIICSYNNATFAEKNLKSLLDQDYTNFRVYYVNDASKDETKSVVEHFLRTHPKGHLVTLINNSVNKGSHVENQYLTAKRYARPDDIVVILDGDDTLADTQVLTNVAKVYSNYPVWLTYGQYAPSRGGLGGCTAIPLEVVENNTFRQFTFVQSHLRTFYAWLLLKVPEEELKYQGRFTNFAGDVMEMFPMCELAGERIVFTDRVFYNYEQENPISDFRLNPGPVEEVLQDIKKRTPLKRLNDSDTLVRTDRIMKIGLLFHATGKYIDFASHAIESARKNFLPRHDVTFFVFTDAIGHPISNDPDVVFVPTSKEPWPWGSMRRHGNYLKHKRLFDGIDYLFATDVDISVVAPVGDEILGELVGTRHPGFNNRKAEYCKDRRYNAFVDRDKEGEVYFMGGFFGGSREQFLQLVETTANYVHIDFDVKGLDPNPDAGTTWFWHDESYLNRYFIDHPPTITLPSSYGYQPNYKYPEGVTPKILLVDKDNAAMHQ